MNHKKKNVFVIVLVLLLLVSASLGVSFAYLTSSLESRANNFTFSNVSIDLVEEKWDSLTPQDKVVYPNRSVVKDPKVKNTGENDLYVYIEVKVPRGNIKTVNSDETVNDAKWTNLLTFDINSGWELIETSVSDDGLYESRLYAYTDSALKPNEVTNTLFDKVTFVNMLEGEFEKGSEFEMPVAAYAIQSDYLDEQGSTVKDKMASALEKYKTEAQK